MSAPHKSYPDDPSYDLDRHLAYVQQLHSKYHYNNEDACEGLVLKYAHPNLIWEVLLAEGLLAPTKPTAEGRQHLIYLQAVYTGHHAVAAAQLMADMLPAVPGGPAQFTVPLHTLIDCREFIRKVQHLAASQLDGIGIFPRLRNRLATNLITASGYDTATYTDKRLTFADESKLEGEELVVAYLDGTGFDAFLETPVSFSIPDSVRNEHFLTVARTGSGKTQFIQRDILDNLLRPDGPGMVVIDSQNQMIPKLETLQAAEDRIVIVDPFDVSPPALNMFLSPRPPITDPHLRESIEAHTLQQFAWIFSVLDQELTGRQTTLFTFTTRILLAMKANMQTLLDFMRIEKSKELQASKFWPYIESSDEQTRYFFDNRFCTSDYNKTKDGVVDRLLGVLRVPSFNRMFMAPANNLDLYSLLAQRKLVVFNTHKSRLSNVASAILGRYAISLYIRAAFERELDIDPPPAFLYIDEASEYFGKKDSTDTLFTQLRKYNCGTFVAFQDLSQLGEQHHTLIANTSTKLTGGLAVADARRLAPDMRTTEAELMGVRKQGNTFEMMCYTGNVTSQALKLTFEYGAVENAPQLTAQEHAALRERNRRLLSARPLHVPPQKHAAVEPTSVPEQTPPGIPTPPHNNSADIPSSEIKPGKDWSRE